MKRRSLFVLIVVAVMAVSFLAGIAQAEDKMATPAQAKELAKKIATYVKEVGCEKGLAAMNDPKGSFNSTYTNAYATANDWNGVTLAQARFPYLVGQNHMALKDADGKPFIKNAIEKAKKDGHAQEVYKWMITKTNKVETRTLYFETVDCGKSGRINVGITYLGGM